MGAYKFNHTISFLLKNTRLKNYFMGYQNLFLLGERLLFPMANKLRKKWTNGTPNEHLFGKASNEPWWHEMNARQMMMGQSNDQNGFSKTINGAWLDQSMKRGWNAPTWGNSGGGEITGERRCWNQEREIGLKYVMKGER